MAILSVLVRLQYDKNRFDWLFLHELSDDEMLT